MLCRQILRNKLFVVPSYKRFNTDDIIGRYNPVPKCDCLDECKFKRSSHERDEFVGKGFIINMSIGAISSLSGAIFGLEGIVFGALFGILLIYLNGMCVLAPIMIHKQRKIGKYRSICRRH